MSRIETVRSRFDVDATAAPDRARLAVVGRRIALAGVCAIAVFFGSVEIRDEGYVSLQGDMPRHMMNGAFIADLLKDRPFASIDTLLEYTQLYYARYPALSLGHHPPLLPLAEVPLFTIFGPSVGAARMVVLLSLIAAVALLFSLVADRYGPIAGFISAALFATSPLIVELGQSVLSEVLAIALLLAAACALQRFWTSNSRWALAGFVLSATMSLYAKQLAVFAFPAFIFLSWEVAGWRRLVRFDVFVAMAAVAVLTIPLAMMTMSLAPSNFTFVAETLAGPRDRLAPSLLRALDPQLSRPVVILAALGMVLAVVRRDRRAALFVAWIAGVFLGLMLFGLAGLSRFSVYWVPAICAMAGSLAGGWRRPWVSRLFAAALVAALAVQAAAANAVRLPKATGYEEAARFVLASEPGPSVLFSATVDTGFFTFFVRKHDPERRLIVLRADKILTTSYLSASESKSRIEQLSDVYPILRRYGVRYVVLEDRATLAPTLEAFRQELRTPSFVERQRIELDSSDWRLKGKSLVVYEFLGATPPDPDAALTMEMPVVSRSLQVKLSDLINRKYLR